MTPHIEPWRYPTSEQIIQKPVPIRKEVSEAIATWKLSHKRLNNEIALIDLLKKLQQIYNVKVNIAFGASWAHFNAKDNTIYLVNKSILTLLHEFAHKLFGRSEYKACRWSAWVFMKCFPERMMKLEWKGHLLVAKNNASSTKLTTRFTSHT